MHVYKCLYVETCIKKSLHMFYFLTYEQYNAISVTVIRGCSPFKQVKQKFDVKPEQTGKTGFVWCNDNTVLFTFIIKVILNPKLPESAPV